MLKSKKKKGELDKKKSDSKIYKDPGMLLFVIKKEKILFSEKSKFQNVEVFQSKKFGRVLLIDDDINVTESDENNYHEMIVHVPMIYKQNATKALVIGGGDGGTARELLRYKNLHVTMVEIDEVVIKAAKAHLPFTASSFEDPNLNLIIGDGAKYIQNYNGEKFDVIIVDSTDFNQGKKLFTEEFYKNIKKQLKLDGIFVFNNDSYFNSQLDLIVEPIQFMKKIFNFVFPYQLFIPTYNGGHYTMIFCSNTIHPIQTRIDFRSWKKLNLDTEYYNEGIHLGSFFLPNNLKKKLKKLKN